MNKLKLIGLLAVLAAASQEATAQQWPQSEQSYRQAAPSPNWANNSQGTPPINAPYGNYRNNAGQGYYGNNNPNFNMPNPYPYYIPQVNVRQPGFMQQNGYNNGYFPGGNNGWGNNGFPNQNFNMPNFNNNNMPFMGNNGNNPWSNMPDMPNPDFEFPTMNFPSWN